MKIRLLLFIVLVSLLFIPLKSQTTEVFQDLQIEKLDRNTQQWGIIPTQETSEYYITFDSKTNKMTVVRAFDKKDMNFIQVMVFSTPNPVWMLSGLIVAEDMSTYPVVGFIMENKLVLNLGELIYTFTKQSEKEIEKL
jgi:hypothetical protein